jgi:hypothetical protein
LEDYDGYQLICSSCNHARVKPARHEDEVILWVVDIFAGWSGYRVQKATDEDLAAINRAKDILDRGLAELRKKQAKWN